MVARSLSFRPKRPAALTPSLPTVTEMAALCEHMKRGRTFHPGGRSHSHFSPRRELCICAPAGFFVVVVVVFPLSCFLECSKQTRPYENIHLAQSPMTMNLRQPSEIFTRKPWDLGRTGSCHGRRGERMRRVYVVPRRPSWDFSKAGLKWNIGTGSLLIPTSHSRLQ